jgi:Rap1a immunity proteins
MITKPNVRTLLLFLTIVPAVFVSLNATVYYSGNDIYPLCSTSKVFISGYVTGAFDRASLDQSTLITYSMEVYDVSVSQARAEKNGIALREEYAKIRGYCAPNQANIGQIVDIFCQYLGKNPASRHLAGAELLNSALSEAWPCSNK